MNEEMEEEVKEEEDEEKEEMEAAPRGEWRSGDHEGMKAT